MSGGRTRPERFSITKTREFDGTEKGKTYVDVSFNVSDEDEVAAASVADIGVDGDRASRVSLDEVG